MAKFRVSMAIRVAGGGHLVGSILSRCCKNVIKLVLGSEGSRCRKGNGQTPNPSNTETLTWRP